MRDTDSARPPPEPLHDIEPGGAGGGGLAAARETASAAAPARRC